MLEINKIYNVDWIEGFKNLDNESIDIRGERMKPEERGKLIISTWLNQNNIKVYWEQKNQFNYPIFKIKGKIKRGADILFYSDNLNQWIIIEFKSTNNAEIRKAKKIIQYYNDLINKDIEYFIDNKKINPSIFLVATEHSKLGFLSDNEIIYKIIDEETSKIWGTPKIEYIKTHQFYRDLIYDWKNPNPNFSLGILLGENDIPKIMIKTYNIYRNKWWWHRFWRI